jgi:hypothetical protein
MQKVLIADAVLANALAIFPCGTSYTTERRPPWLGFGLHAACGVHAAGGHCQRHGDTIRDGPGRYFCGGRDNEALLCGRDRYLGIFVGIFVARKTMRQNVQAGFVVKFIIQRLKVKVHLISFV